MRCELVEAIAAYPHPSIADAIDTFSRAKSAGEGKARARDDQTRYCVTVPVTPQLSDTT
jgi:hypothetical protein